ncbi:MAG: hypothetical protein ACREEW_18160 [Caulobacteraceae bacterium]
MVRATIYARPYRPGDAERFAARADMASEKAAVDWDWEAGAPPGTRTLVRFPGEVIGLGGAIDAGGGVFQAWACLAPVPRGDWPLLFGCANAVLNEAELRRGARRIVALVRTDWDAARRTLERLGFSRSAETSQWEGFSVMAREAPRGEKNR